MVDADEETALLSAARDAAGQPPRRRGRVVAFVLVIGGVLAFVAAAGRGAAEDGAPFQVSGQPTMAPPKPPLANLEDINPGLLHRGGRYHPGYYGETRQISPLNGPPASNYFHKDPNYAPVTSFFAKILSRPTRVLEMAMGLGKEKGLDIVGQKAETDINGQWYSQ